MNWGEIESAIFNLSSFSWVLALLLALAAQYKKVDYSTRLTVFIWVAFDLVTLLVTPIIFNLSETSVNLTRQVWYVSFAFIALTQMILMSYIHVRLNLVKSGLAKFVMFALMCSIFINIVRYFDRIVLETDVFADLYRYGILSMKLCVLVLIAKYVAKNKGVSFAN
jgi:hypothetical protein